jgi:hypothetical protein
VVNIFDEKKTRHKKESENEMEFDELFFPVTTNSIPTASSVDIGTRRVIASDIGFFWIVGNLMQRKIIVFSFCFYRGKCAHDHARATGGLAR